jgi:hypothetical protein
LNELDDVVDLLRGLRQFGDVFVGLDCASVAAAPTTSVARAS